MWKKSLQIGGDHLAPECQEHSPVTSGEERSRKGKQQVQRPQGWWELSMVWEKCGCNRVNQGEVGGDEEGGPGRPWWGIWSLVGAIEGCGHCTQKWKAAGVSSETSFFKNEEDVGQLSVSAQHKCWWGKGEQDWLRAGQQTIRPRKAWSTGHMSW